MAQKFFNSCFNTLRQIHVGLCTMNRFFFILLGTILLTLTSIIITSIPGSESLHDVEGIQEIKALGAIEAFFTVIIFAPILETVLFQLIPIRLPLLISKKIKSFYLILVSAILFSLWHCYNATYMIVMFFGGLVLAYFFVVSMKRREYGFLNITAIHMLSNLVPYSMDFIFV